MAEHGHKIVYLLVERPVSNGFKKSHPTASGEVFGCRHGSLNVKIDIHLGLTLNIRERKAFGERTEAESVIENDESLKDSSRKSIAGTSFDEAYDDETFVCNDCRNEKTTDEAYQVYDGGAVCTDCAEGYESCERCEYYFPKSIRGTHCPKCSGSGASGNQGGLNR